MFSLLTIVTHDHSAISAPPRVIEIGNWNYDWPETEWKDWEKWFGRKEILNNEHLHNCDNSVSYGLRS